MNKKTKKGFTITELVIVIAVIAILAAVLIPTFSNVIKNANESVALQEARSEWDNFLPEIADKDAAQKGDYVVVYHKTGKDQKYFLAMGGEFDTTIHTPETDKDLTAASATLTITSGSTSTTYTLTAMDYKTDAEKAKETCTVYKLTVQP